MKRRTALATGTAVFVASQGAAQPRGSLPMVGLLCGATRESERDRIDVFKAMLAELGRKPGQTIQLEERYADGDASRIPMLAKDLVGLKPDVIGCTGPTEALALQAATRDIPIVFMQVPDPVAAGLVTSIARPTGNVTGLSQGPLLVVGKCIELLVELLGKGDRIGMLGNPENAGYEGKVADAMAVAKRLGVLVEPQVARKPEDIDVAFSALTGADGIFVQFDFLLFNHRPRIAELALKHRLASVFENRSFVDDGGLMSLGANLRQNYRQGALYIDRILKGMRPESLPVEQAGIFELVINLKTAQALGLSVPPALYARADEVIE